MSTTNSPISAADVDQLSDDEITVTLSMLAEPAERVLGGMVFWRDLDGRRETLTDILADKKPLGMMTEPWERERARWMPRMPRLADLRRSVERIHDRGIQILTPASPEWPARLLDLSILSPTALYVRGDAAVLSQNAFAVTGARASTSYGEHVTREFTDALAKNFAIVSGAAWGTESTALRATVATGGKAIAIMAGGAERVYPAGNEQLIEHVIDNGALITEIPWGAPTRHRFLQRGRVLAALASGLLIPEAGARSGALHVAEHARRLRRPVWVIPGPITSPTSHGGFELLREHASTRLAYDASQIIEHHLSTAA